MTKTDDSKIDGEAMLSHFRLQNSDSSKIDGDSLSMHGSGPESSSSIPSIEFDVEQKSLAMARISKSLFVPDADSDDFRGVQDWITACANQVQLPINFCGGVFIMRLCRRLVPAELQTDEWSSAVQEFAAAYDFAFLALGHADDEADLTHERGGLPTRWKTHPHTRAVDGINLLLAGMTSAKDTLHNWPAIASLRQPNAKRIFGELLRALREASFPILLDRAGFGHVRSEEGSRELFELEIDRRSLNRVALYSRHRAHTYFLRAVWIAVLASGYEDIEPELETLLSRLFELLGSIGAASDDLQDTFVDLSARVHSVVSVMAHLCVAEDQTLRPSFRKDIEDLNLQFQRERLFELWGTPWEELDRNQALQLLEVIELRQALYHHYEPQCIEFANCMYKAVTDYGFSVELMSEIVSFVCRDKDFSIPSGYILMLRSLKDETSIQIANTEIGKYIANYFLDRFFPSDV